MRKISALLVILMLLSVPAAAGKPLMFRFKGVGVDEELIDAAMMLFRGALEEEGKYMPVSAFDLLGDTGCNKADCAATFASGAGFGTAIVGSITRLGGKYIVRVQLVNAEDASVIFSEDGVSRTEEDLDVVLARLARSVTTGRKLDKTAEVGLITEREAEKPLRRESYSSKGLRAGFIWPLEDSFGNGVDRLIVLDLAYQYDLSDYYLMGRSGIRWGDGACDICFFDAKIGRYLSRSDFSPFINAGLGIHYIRGVDVIEEGGFEEHRKDGSYGLMMMAGTGFTAFRTYNFQFQIDVDYFIMLDDINPSEESGGEIKPQGVLFTFCIRKGRSDD